MATTICDQPPQNQDVVALIK